MIAVEKTDSLHSKEISPLYFAAKVTVLENNDDLLGASFTFEEILEIIGDVDGDGELSVRDALMMRKRLANILGDGDVNIENADLTGDGTFNAKDLLALRKMLAQ